MKAAAAPIHLYGSSGLRRTAREAESGTDVTAELLDRLWASLDKAGGVGLAAPQIGADLRVVVVRDTSRRGDGQRLELVNPEVVETFGPTVPFEEGCLSFPGLYTLVRRPRGARIRYRARDGEARELQGEGLAVRIALHEIDHLDGVLFVDRLPAWRRWTLAPRLLGIRLHQWLRPRGS